MTTKTSVENGNLTLVRTYNAPIEKVFDAWIETSKIKQWWGCAECTDVRSEVEPKVGGKYNHHMTIETPQGRHEAEGFSTLTEYNPPHRLAYTSNDIEDKMLITVDFVEVPEGTQVTLVHANIPDILVQGDVKLTDIVKGGWSAAFSKLDTLLNNDIAVS